MAIGRPGTVAVGSAAWTTGIDVYYPTGMTNGSLALLWAFRDEDDLGTWQPLTGWTQIAAFTGSLINGRDRSFSLYTRNITGSEAAFETVVGDVATARDMAAVIVEYPGYDQLDVTPTASHLSPTDAANNFAPPNQAITTLTDAAVVVLLNGQTPFAMTSYAAPTNYTLVTSDVSNTNAKIAVAEFQTTTAGLESPGDWLNTGGDTGDEYVTATLALRPISGGGAPEISDINTDEIIAHEEAFTLTGLNLPDGNGSSAVTLSPSNSISDPSAVVQTGITWTSATSLSGTGMNYIGTGIAKGGTGYVFVTNAAGTSNTTGFQITRQDDAPTILTSVIDTLGTSLTMTADEAITIGTGGSGGFTLSTGETLTYSSGSGSATVVYSISPAVEGGTSPTLAYTQPTDGWEDGTGDDLATFSGASITNNSTVDTTAPIPTNPTADNVTNAEVTPAFIANENTGTAYVVLVPDGDVPSVAQIKLGQQSSGAAAIAADSDPITATGAHAFAAMTGLTGNTAYELYFVHTDASNNDSAAITVGFTTQSATATVSGIAGGLNLTALAYTVFAGYNIGTSTILKQGTGETTDGSGNLTIPLDDTAAGDGDPVTIVIADYTTAPTAASSGAVCYTAVSVA